LDELYSNWPNQLEEKHQFFDEIFEDILSCVEHDPGKDNRIKFKKSIEYVRLKANFLLIETIESNDFDFEKLLQIDRKVHRSIIHKILDQNINKDELVNELKKSLVKKI